MNTMQVCIRSIGLMVVLFFLFGISIAFAQGGSVGSGGTTVTLDNPLGQNCKDLSCPLAAVANFLFTISIPLAGILILWGGFQMMTAAGNVEKISQGKKTILWTVIGFVVVLIAGSVAQLIQNIFGGGAQ